MDLPATQAAAVISFGIALLSVLALTPLAIRIARRTDFHDRPTGFKAHALPTPYLGGAAVIAAFVGASMTTAPGAAAPIAAGAVGLWIVGTVDDIRTVPPLGRVAAAAAGATALWSTGLGWHVFGSDALNLVLTNLWIVGLVNAFNLMDNVDGATASVGAASAAGVAALAFAADAGERACVALALCGACLGFLRYNLASPARIFLGDGGSMPIGFVVAATALALPQRGAPSWQLLVVAGLVVALPVFDTALVLVSRRRRRAPLFSGNVDHLTHRLRTRLPSVRAVATTLAAAQAALCSIALAVHELGGVSVAVAAALSVALGVTALCLFESARWLPVNLSRATGPEDRRVRVLRIIARMNVGGPAYHVSLLSGRLDPERYETLLVTGTVGPGEASLEELVERDGANLLRVQKLGPEIRPLRDVAALVELIRVVRRFRPDIVHTHTAKAGFVGRAAAVLAMRPRPIIIHTYHGHVLTGYFGRSQTAIYRFLERLLARVSDVLIGVSRATVDDLVSLGIAPRAKFRVIPVGLDLRRFAYANGPERAKFRKQVGAADDDVLFAYIGRLVPIKRVDRALRAVAAARAGGAPVRLAVIGDGVMRTELEALSAELDLNGHVRFLGYRTAVEEVTAGCDAVLLTSDNEGTPVSLIEAGATGLPGIATAVGGVPETIEDAGILVAPDDARALTDAVVRLTRDPRLRAELGSRARVAMLHRFDAARLIRDIEALYAEILTSRKATGLRVSR